VVDRTICVYVLSLAIKPLSIRTAALTIAPLALLDNQLVFEVIIVHRLDQPNGDSLRREKITTFNPTSKQWELDSTPDRGQQQLQLPTAANVVPPTTPSAPTLPPSPSPSYMKGAFFSGGYATPGMSVAKQKEMLALQMIHMKQVFENM
jgi:hypothetical protein